MPWVRRALHAGDQAPAAAWLIHGVHVALLCDLPQRTRWVNRNARIFRVDCDRSLEFSSRVFLRRLSVNLRRPVKSDSSQHLTEMSKIALG